MALRWIRIWCDTSPRHKRTKWYYKPLFGLIFRSHYHTLWYCYYIASDITAVHGKSREKRLEILAAAGEVFREKGYAQTSMAEISARVGGSKGTLYGYFQSKEDLFAAVILDFTRRSVTPLLDEFEATDDASTQIPIFMRKLMQILVSTEFIPYSRMLIGEAGRSSIGRIANEQGTRKYLQKFAEHFAVQIRKGRFRNANPWQAALHMHSLCAGGPVQMVLEGAVDRPSDAEIDSAAHAAAEVFLRAYSPEAAAATRKTRTAK